VAIIRAGGITEVEVIDTKYRLGSAMYSAKAAVEEGWLPGGALPLYLVGNSIKSQISNEGAEAAGMSVVANAIQAPLQALIANAGHSYTQILSEIDQRPEATFGFNVDTGLVEDLVRAGVIDAAKMVKGALQIAFSHAKAILQTSEWDLSRSEPRTEDS